MLRARNGVGDRLGPVILAEIGVGEGLDEPLRKPSQFRTEAERAGHIQNVATEIQHILDGDADG